MKLQKKENITFMINFKYITYPTVFKEHYTTYKGNITSQNTQLDLIFKKLFVPISFEKV